MARYQLILAYDGTQFAGFQRQARGRTVQGELESGLRRLGWTGNTIYSAGRTDTGVHAEGQCAAVDLEWPHSNEDLLQAINANLPEDLVVRSLRQVPGSFHPRFSATARVYRYQILCDETRDPLCDRFTWRVWPRLEPDLLIAAAALITGEHDFKAFGSPPKPGTTTVRQIFSADWSITGRQYCFEVRGNAFLYHMVRRLVFIQAQIGQGRLTTADLQESLDHQTRLKPGLAPARGLTLVRVEYGTPRDENHQHHHLAEGSEE